MVATAPAAVAAASFSGDDAAAMTRAPRCVATSTAARPIPPPAPSTSTHSPGTRRVRRVKLKSIVP